MQITEKQQITENIPRLFPWKYAVFSTKICSHPSKVNFNLIKKIPQRKHMLIGLKSCFYLTILIIRK